MREILFRGKRVDNGEWVEGNLFIDPDLEKYFICGFNYFTADYALQREEVNCEVDPETVGQYTGLTDKNGKMIFEGDIVRYGSAYHQVVFEKRCGNAYFGIVMSEWRRGALTTKLQRILMEVVGNIHDNPELIGGDP